MISAEADRFVLCFSLVRVFNKLLDIAIASILATSHSGYAFFPSCVRLAFDDRILTERINGQRQQRRRGSRISATSNHRLPRSGTKLVNWFFKCYVRIG